MRVRSLALLLVLGIATGCSQVSDIRANNIPADPMDKYPADPNAWSAIDAEAAALKHVIEAYPPYGPYIVVVPQGTSMTSRGSLYGNLPEGARDQQLPGETLPVYSVLQVTLLLTEGQVDVYAPTEAEGRRLVSVYVRRSGTDWRVAGTKVWAEPLSEALRLARPPLNADGEREFPAAGALR